MSYVYLSGPMRRYPEFNFPAFRQAAEWLRSTGLGVISPHEKDEQTGFDVTGMTGHEDLSLHGFDLHAALAWDMKVIATPECSGLVCLEGWTVSSGARAEVALALALGKPVDELWHDGSVDYTSGDFRWRPRLVRVTPEIHVEVCRDAA